MKSIDDEESKRWLETYYKRKGNGKLVYSTECKTAVSVFAQLTGRVGKRTTRRSHLTKKDVFHWQQSIRERSGEIMYEIRSQPQHKRAFLNQLAGHGDLGISRTRELVGIRLCGEDTSAYRYAEHLLIIEVEWSPYSEAVGWISTTTKTHGLLSSGMAHAVGISSKALLFLFTVSERAIIYCTSLGNSPD